MFPPHACSPPTPPELVHSSLQGNIESQDDYFWFGMLLMFYYALMMSLNHGFGSFIRYIFENSYKPHLFMTFKIYVLTFFSGVYPKYSLFRDGLWRVTFLSLVRTALSGFSFCFHGDLITARILLHVIFPKK